MIIPLVPKGFLTAPEGRDPVIIPPKNPNGFALVVPGVPPLTTIGFLVTGVGLPDGPKITGDLVL